MHTIQTTSMTTMLFSNCAKPKGSRGEPSDVAAAGSQHTGVGDDEAYVASCDHRRDRYMDCVAAAKNFLYVLKRE